MPHKKKARKRRSLKGGTNVNTAKLLRKLEAEEAIRNKRSRSKRRGR